MIHDHDDFSLIRVADQVHGATHTLDHFARNCSPNDERLFKTILVASTHTHVAAIKSHQLKVVIMIQLLKLTLPNRQTMKPARQTQVVNSRYHRRGVTQSLH